MNLIDLFQGRIKTMDKIILGCLMIRGMSAYDVKTYVRKNLSSMCSNSSGSIYTALSKLLHKGYIGEEALAKDSRDKKMYYITKEGRMFFLQWLDTPMSSEKAKNMELAKLFFGGIQDKHKQIICLKEFVSSIKEELEGLLMIQKIQGNQTPQSIETMQQYLLDDPYNEEGLKAIGKKSLPYEMVQQIYQNQMRTLEYGIAEITFQIQWYEKTIEEMEKENE